MIDGGKGQLSAAMKSLDVARLGFAMCISLAKENEEVHVPKNKNPYRNSKIQAVTKNFAICPRDETHRFGVAYNQNNTEKSN